MADEGQGEAEGAPIAELFSEDVKCENCVRDELALAYCKNCSRLLCSDCLNSHKKQRDTLNHDVAESERAEEIRRLYLCTEHRMQHKNFYCSDCNKPVCNYCILTSCKQHRYLIVNAVQEEIQEKLDQVRETEEAFTRHVEHIGQVSQQNKAAFEQTKVEINEAVDNAIKVLERHRMEFLQQLEKVTKTNDEEVAVQEREVHDKLAEIKKSIKDAESLQKSEKEAKIMSNRNDTLDTLDKVRAYTWNPDMVRPRAWRLKSASRHITEFGKLTPRPLQQDIIIEGLQNSSVVGIPNSFTITVRLGESIGRSNIALRITVKPSSTSERIEIVPTLSKREAITNCWVVTYFLHETGEVKISLSVCETEAEGSPFTLQAERMELRRGMRVMRGPDWKWGEQDGGMGSKGEVVDVKANGWVIVKWQNTRQKPSDYRWGAQSAYDLTIVKENQ